MQTAANTILFVTGLAFLWVSWSLNWTAAVEVDTIYQSRLAAFRRLRRVYYAAIVLAFATYLVLAGHAAVRGIAAGGPDLTRKVLAAAAALSAVAAVFGAMVVYDARVRRRG